MNNNKKNTKIISMDKKKKNLLYIILFIVILLNGVMIFSACTYNRSSSADAATIPPIRVSTEFGAFDISLSNNDSIKEAYSGKKLTNLYKKASDLAVDEKELISYFINRGDEFFDLYSQKYYVPEKSSLITFDKTNFANPFIISAEKSGVKVEKGKMLESLLAAIDNGKKEYHMSVVLSEIPPEITKEENLLKTTLRGSFTTSYYSSGENRSHNVELSAEKINGFILSPNADFSFNTIVGRRSLENGFLPAPIIVNGDFRMSPGGGVCQTASTLYNAAMLADLSIKTRMNHSIMSSYVDGGRDAMISGGQDLVFSNSSTGDIYITAKSEKSHKITFNIYGENLPYLIELRSKKTKTLSPSIKFTHSTNPKDTEQKVITAGRNGYAYETYAEYFEMKNGIKTLIKTDKKPDSHYPKKDTVISLPYMAKPQ